MSLRLQLTPWPIGSGWRRAVEGAEVESSLIQSIRVDDPNDYRVVVMALAGWRVVDITYDPHQRNWVVTFQWDMSS